MNQFPYFTEIEDAFVRCRGKSLLLSPKDWALIESWQIKGIPQHIVIGAIEGVFEKQGGNVSTLAFCSKAVEERFAVWADGQIGKGVDELLEVELTACSVCGKEICFSLHRE